MMSRCTPTIFYKLLKRVIFSQCVRNLSTENYNGKIGVSAVCHVVVDFKRKLQLLVYQITLFVMEFKYSNRVVTIKHVLSVSGPGTIGVNALQHVVVVSDSKLLKVVNP